MLYNKAWLVLKCKFLLPFVCMVLPAISFAQQPLVQTFIDKNDILIGEQIQYKVKASFPTGVYNVHWLNIPDSIAHFEVVEKSKIDSTYEDNTTILQQTITLTSFDSGRWNTPAFAINFDPAKADTTLHFFTDSIPVNVGYAPPDSTNQLRDIKPIIEVTITSYFWYYVGGGLLLLLIIAFFIRRYLKNRKKDIAPQFNSRLTPFDEAMQELDKLKTLQLQNPEEIKQYHSAVAKIFKWYISRRLRVSILNKTTGDVLVLLSDSGVSKDVITDTAAALRTGDAVKFAKYLPAISESENSAAAIRAVINTIHSSKPLNN